MVEHHWKVEGQIDDDPRDIIYAFLGKMPPGLTTGATPWHLDLTDCTYLGPDAAALILALHLDAEDSQVQHRISLPESPPKLVNFCRYSGLEHWLHGAPQPNPHHARNVTAALEQHRRAQRRIPQVIEALIRRHTVLSADAGYYLQVAMAEVFQNVEDHAQSIIGGISCARYIAAQHQVRVAIVDRGRGIGTTLRAAYPEIEDTGEALRCVIEGRYSARTQPHNEGLGISWLWQLVTENQGTVFILSQDAMAQSKTGSRTPEILTLETHWAGTGVFFSLPVDLQDDD